MIRRPTSKIMEHTGVPSLCRCPYKESTIGGNVTYAAFPSASTTPYGTASGSLSYLSCKYTVYGGAYYDETHMVVGEYFDIGGSQGIVKLDHGLSFSTNETNLVPDMMILVCDFVTQGLGSISTIFHLDIYAWDWINSVYININTMCTNVGFTGIQSHYAETNDHVNIPSHPLMFLIPLECISSTDSAVIIRFLMEEKTIPSSYSPYIPALRIDVCQINYRDISFLDKSSLYFPYVHTRSPGRVSESTGFVFPKNFEAFYDNPLVPRILSGEYVLTQNKFTPRNPGATGGSNAGTWPYAVKSYNTHGRKARHSLVVPESTSNIASSGSDETFSRGDHVHELVYGDSTTAIPVVAGNCITGGQITYLWDAMEDVVSELTDPLIRTFEYNGEWRGYGVSTSEKRFTELGANLWNWRFSHSTEIPVFHEAATRNGYPSTVRIGITDSSSGFRLSSLKKWTESGLVTTNIPGTSTQEPNKISDLVYANIEAQTYNTGDYSFSTAIWWAVDDSYGYAFYRINIKPASTTYFRGFGIYKFNISTGAIVSFQTYCYDLGSGSTTPAANGFSGSVQSVSANYVCFSYGSKIGVANFTTGSLSWNEKDVSSIGTAGAGGRWHYYIDYNENYLYGAYVNTGTFGVYRWDLTTGSNQRGGTSADWPAAYGASSGNTISRISGYEDRICIEYRNNSGKKWQLYFQINESSITSKGVQMTKFSTPTLGGHLPYPLPTESAYKTWFDDTYAIPNISSDGSVITGGAIDNLRFRCEQWSAMLFYDGWPNSLRGSTGTYKTIANFPPEEEDGEQGALYERVPEEQNAWVHGPSCVGFPLYDVIYEEIASMISGMVSGGVYGFSLIFTGSHG